VAYESVLLGLFNIWRGESRLREKVNEVTLGFSRDGFHWARPDRRSFLPVSEERGSWNYSNIQSAGGGCLIVGDQLYFYMSGRTGVPGTDLPGTCSTGLATLRRDGFASLDFDPQDARPRRLIEGVTGGTLLTRPVTFSGGHLFVNADLAGGELRVAALEATGQPITGLTEDLCVPISGNATRLAVRWQGSSLESVAGRPVRLRFTFTKGRFYSFWVSRWPTGESGGFVAAGGPGFSGPTDTR
jgi:hypothetical protein